MPQSANRIAWLLLGFIALAAAGFAMFLLIATGSDNIDSARGTAQADASTNAQADSQPATATPGSASLPPRRVERTGVVDHVSGHALSIRTTTHGQQRILLRTGAGVVRVRNLPDVSAIGTGDTVIAHTGILVRDAFKPPEDTGRVRRIIILSDPLPPGPSPECPFVGSHLGTVVAVTPASLQLQTACGEQLLELLSSPEVQRYTSASITDLAIGQRITVHGELLPDGTVSGTFIQILEP